MTTSIVRAVTSRWLSILEEYEKVKAGQNCLFATVNDLCEAHHVHRKDIRKYYERWIKSGKDRSALLPQKRGPRPGKYKRLSKEEERLILKIHRRLGANEFEIFEMLKSRFSVPPSVSTIYRTFKRYPLNKKRKESIKRYVKRYPGELLHADTYQLAKAMMHDARHRWCPAYLYETVSTSNQWQNRALLANCRSRVYLSPRPRTLSRNTVRGTQQLFVSL